MSQLYAHERVAGTSAVNPRTPTFTALTKPAVAYGAARSPASSYLLAAMAAWANSCSKSAAANFAESRKETNSCPVEMPPLI